ncbi:MAG: decarboxylating 6-phosphogluconate dehydrogenase [Acidobacteriota bacterium]|nr:decarboxylating 6-phosphogluconate dehydrogenase [Acidobacteriota bacterium]MDE3044606.1 decarboxylating 6-phosphogluconate dehydrogenase [Acidobacteriota bacterium]MDE3107969.1 decarboxylating 6-phosphogluconate dehydrogenase [Acidobacteriota bacterium]
MRIGMVGLGRMGANLVQRLARDGHECVVYDVNDKAAQALVGARVRAASSLEDLVAQLSGPRVIWLMLPAAVTHGAIEELARYVEADDVLLDGGNSFYQDDIARAKELAARGVHYVDCGTSGGVWGLERGYSLMIGGEKEVVERLDPIFRTIAPGADGTTPTVGRTRSDGTAQLGYLHCGPAGAGHFVKMVHNGIEYGMMAAIGEGLSILRHADVGTREVEADAETTPLRNPEFYAYDFDLAEVTEVWRHGSVISSWLLDLTADALARSPQLEEYGGRVSDSGEGRWTLEAAINESVPAPVLSAAIFQRFESRGLGAFTAKVLSAMRAGFGGHAEKSA